MELLTNSRARAFRRCARFHHLAYELGYRLREQAHALTFGTLIHLALEVWWRWFMTALAVWDLETAEAAMSLALMRLRGEPGVDAFDLVRAEELMRGYHYRWLPEMEDLEVLAVEEQFEAPLINPATGARSLTFRQAGKIDVITRRRSTGRKGIIDHKTSSEDFGVGSTYVAKLRLDPQASMYMDGARSLGHDAGDCTWDLIGKPQLKPYKATPLEERKYTKEKQDKAGNVVDPSRLYAAQRESDETPDEYRARLREAIAAAPDRYYQRHPIVRLEDEMEDHRYDLWQTAALIRESRLARRAPKNPDACSMFGRLCPFFGPCTGGASLEDPALFEKLDNPHVELAKAS